MEKENFYRTIGRILSRRLTPPYDKEAIKSEIVRAIAGENYINAITAYLWEAYINFDAQAKVAFQEIFFDDLKEHNLAAFYFFSFYFSNNFQRGGFDRRADVDRRNTYSLDFFADAIIERRKGKERREDAEKRLSWTRITKWVSVPFRVDTGKEGDAEYQTTADQARLNTILSDLAQYYERYIERGQTDWLTFTDNETFERAKKVMISLIQIEIPNREIEHGKME